MAALRKMEYYPQGTRWPWYPLYTANVDLVEESVTQGELNLTLAPTDIQLRRIGLRRWAKHQLHKVR